MPSPGLARPRLLALLGQGSVSGVWSKLEGQHRVASLRAYLQRFLGYSHQHCLVALAVGECRPPSWFTVTSEFRSPRLHLRVMLLINYVINCSHSVSCPNDKLPAWHCPGSTPSSYLFMCYLQPELLLVLFLDLCT